MDRSRDCNTCAWLFRDRSERLTSMIRQAHGLEGHGVFHYCHSLSSATQICRLYWGSGLWFKVDAYQIFRSFQGRTSVRVRTVGPLTSKTYSLFLDFYASTPALCLQSLSLMSYLTMRNSIHGAFSLCCGVRRLQFRAA